MIYFFSSLLLFLSNNLVNCITEDYSAGIEDYVSDENNAINEVFNVSSKEKPLRIRTGQNVSNTSDVRVVANVTDKSYCEDQDIITNEDSEEYKSTLVGYPFAVSIQRKGAHYASGALIGKRWILSSASGFFNVRESIKLFRARLGSVDCKRYGKLVPLKGFELHPSYVYGRPSFDVALIRMATPVEYSNVIRPIGLSHINAKVISAKFITTYWPRILIKGTVIPKTANERIKHNSMRVSSQKMIPLEKCTKALKALNETLDSSSLCLTPIVSHHSVCMPDVGAPVVADDGLWGITSGWISSKCPISPGPTIFTRISTSSVRSWLDTQLLNV